jgi:4'-phosphopantetheinyl transferase
VNDDEVLIFVTPLPLTRAFALPHPQLDADENQRAARFVFAIDRARYIASHLALRHALGAQLGVAPAKVVFQRVAPGAKPRLAPPTLEFNLSQSGALALVAVARGREVGVDVEEQAAIDATPIESQLAPAERAALAALTPAQRVLAMRRLWVRKEAFLKACGAGLARPLADFEISVGAEPQLLATRPDADERARWCLTTIPVPAGYEAALVHATANPAPLPSARVSIRELPWSDIEA